MPTKKSSGKKRGRPSKASVEAREKRIEREAEKKARRQSSAIILFAVSILLACICFIPGENLWRHIHNFMFGMFGFCAYLIPVIVLAISIFTAAGKVSFNYKAKIWQGIVLTALICAAIQVFLEGKPLEENFFEAVKILYTQGIELKGGGLIGSLIGIPLILLFGLNGAKITILLIIFVFICIITGLTLADIGKAAAKPYKKIEESYKERLIEKEKKFDIDVDLGPDYNPMPSHPAFSEKKEEEPIRKVKKSAEEFLEKARNINDEEPKPQKEEKVEAPITPMEIPVETPEEDTTVGTGYSFPPVQLLNSNMAGIGKSYSDELQHNADKLLETLKNFGVAVKILNICRGPAVTRYELQPLAGVKISKITNLADDIALSLAASGVRIEAPIPGKAAVGIEVPNKNVDVVNIREIIDSGEFSSAQSPVTMSLGRDISGAVKTADISSMPHLLIAGATGSGKSVCINSIIISLLYKSSPDNVRLLMIDPKVVELGVYNGIPHLLVPVVTDPRKAAGALAWAVNEMLGRYKTFAEYEVRDIKGYNRLCKTREDLKPLPQIVIIIDELADLMMAAPNEVEDAICRLAQMARAAGMHLIIATQRPSVDVITGVIKANIPSRIAFAVSSQVDSRTILDSGGAEKLLGRGDMLFFPVGKAKPERIQGCFVSDKEVEKVVSFIKNQANATYDDEIMSKIESEAAKEKSSSSSSKSDGDGDDMTEAAIEVVVEAGQASTSLLQRKLKLGYARAARIVDELEEKGIVGPYEGSKPRKVLITKQQWYEMSMRSSEEDGE
jgi:S-DNA-T family DNA segregation ATPase FtsK/SpoIIIE